MHLGRVGTGGKSLGPGPDAPGPLQTLQQHYHPEVSRAASAINQALSLPEVSIAPLLELTAYEVSTGPAAGQGLGVPVRADIMSSSGL